MEIFIGFVCGMIVGIATCLFWRWIRQNFLIEAIEDERPFASREDWNALEPRGPMDTFHDSDYPLKYVIITHTASDTEPLTFEECASHLRTLQLSSFGRQWSDIPYSYVVDGQGTVYEGRGSSIVPATCLGWNTKSLGIAFVGTFIKNELSRKAVSSLKNHLNNLVDQGVLANDFTLYCLGQLRKQFEILQDSELHMEIQTWKGRDGYQWSWREYHNLPQ